MKSYVDFVFFFIVAISICFVIYKNFGNMLFNAVFYLVANDDVSWKESFRKMFIYISHYEKIKNL